MPFSQLTVSYRENSTFILRCVRILCARLVWTPCRSGFWLSVVAQYQILVGRSQRRESIEWQQRNHQLWAASILFLKIQTSTKNANASKDSHVILIHASRQSDRKSQKRLFKIRQNVWSRLCPPLRNSHFCAYSMWEHTPGLFHNCIKDEFVEIRSPIIFMTFYIYFCLSTGLFYSRLFFHAF